MKYLKMQDLKMKDQMSGHENAGPQKHDRKSEDKLPKAITPLITEYFRDNVRDCELCLHLRKLRLLVSYGMC